MLMYHYLGAVCLLQLSEPAGMTALHLFQCTLVVLHPRSCQPNTRGTFLWAAVGAVTFGIGSMITGSH